VHGSPGSGKTYFIRGLLAEVENARFVLVPSNLVEDLGGPTLIPALVKAREDMDPHEALVLIIEDSDRCLGSRDTAMNAISSILNASSGILGSSLNLRVICTTNATYEKLDPALSRTGRLSMEVLVGELSSERASKIYTRLAGGSDFVMPEGSTLSQVYEYVRKNEEIDDEDEEYEDLDD
jgi:ATP-dependent 26S proteasome regulatory subunit